MPYCKNQIPLKKGKTSHYHLSWQFFKDNLSVGNISHKVENWLTHIEETVSGSPRIYVDNTISVIKSDKYVKTKGSNAKDKPTVAIV